MGVSRRNKSPNHYFVNVLASVMVLEIGGHL